MVKRGRLAVIPARGGSKRLPRKNIIDFFGKPLIAWSIEAALASKLFDRIVISTEDAEIAAVARLYGGEVPFLRETHFDDHSNVSDVTIHALQQVEKKCGETFETVAMLQPTCPLREATDITAAIAAFHNEVVDSQISCFRFSGMNPGWAFQRDSNGKAQWLHPEMVGWRSQDQPAIFGLSGAICLSKTKALMNVRTFYGPDVRFEPMSWISAIDIDDEDDLALARAAYLVKHGQVSHTP